MVNVNSDPAAASAEAKKFLDAYYTSNFSAEDLERWGIFGTADQVVNRLQAFIDAGCQIPIVRFTTWNPLGQLRRFAEQVAPRLRPASASAA
jgi:alkanesulfonate monooxygenase SsuD/methylene tetrahydromethanopterin reductase-like flavin-dependent oxidoreductase (luciferase family)